jgi:hypothetical protein
MLPEMLRLRYPSGPAGSSHRPILRRLATYSRKSKLYFAFRELGHAVRTSFLLEYLSDVELRRLIPANSHERSIFTNVSRYRSEATIKRRFPSPAVTWCASQ